MLKIKRVRYMQLKHHLKLVLLGLVLCFGLLSGTASAAGSAVITVEASPVSASTGQTVVLSFYVTPTGADVNSVAVNVSLSNLSYVSYDATGSAFNGIAQVPGGATATSFQVIGAFQSFGGASSKALILRATVTASSSAGTGQVTLSSPEANDTNELPMSASSQNQSVTITAPSSGGGGGGSTGGGGGGGGSTQTPATSSGNTPAVPGTDTGPAAEPTTVPESELIAAENIETAGAGDTSATVVTKQASFGKFASIGAGLVGVLIVIAGVMLFMKRRANSLVTGGMMGGSIDAPTTTASPDPIAPQASPTPEAPEPPENNNGDGPTIIHPQK